ncbi:MAG: S-layer homology domain-containing protein [Syntrophomonas sp.]
MRNGYTKKCISSIVAIVYMLSLMFIQAPAVFAQTQPAVVADASNDILDITGGTSQGIGSKEPGGDISNAVFYIAVKDSSGETKYYYYTRAELEAYETQEAYTYDDHSVIKTVTCKGALLTDMLADLNGVTITDDMIVQYAEEDGYHADAATDVVNSNYKDTVESLTKQTVSGSGSTKSAMRPIVSYLIHEEYESPDEYNVNDPEGVFKDADNNSGYLRVYRDTGGANSAVIKYLMGVAVSTDGALLSGNNGCVLTSVSDKNSTIKVRNDITIKGLVPGMQFAVKAPAVTNAALAAGETTPVLITVGSGAPAEQVVTFKYTEDTYFYVNDLTLCTITNYTYTDLIAMSEQVPDAGANTPPYGYSRPMYYRYNGVWLSDLVKGLSSNSTVRLVAKDGTKTDITANIAQYFVAYNNTRSKTSTNIPEGKRVTVTYDDAKVITPGSGENITGSAEDDYTTAGKDVDVLMAAAEGLEFSSSGGGGGSSGGGGGSSSGSSESASTGQLVKNSGATVSKDGVSVVIPEGAVSSDIRITIAKAEESGLTVSGERTLVSNVYEIIKNKEGNFAKDVTITLPFTKGKAEQSKDELTLCCWSGSEWVAVENVKVDWSAATISGTINHLTKFAVLAKAITPAVPVTVQPETGVILTDISGHWAHDAILAITANGAVSGYQDGSFKPDQTITRAEFATMLVKAFKLPSSGSKVFEDTAGHWAQGYIAAASDAGIVNGNSDKQFNPDALMTREQMAVMIVKAAKAAKSNQEISLKDKAGISAWAQDAVTSAIAANLMSGYPDQTFKPQNNTTRAEAASVIAKVWGQK